MERIRQTSPYALAVFAVVFVGFMVISDVDLSKIFGGQQDYKTAPVATINGEVILRKDYDNLRSQITDSKRAEAKQNQTEYVSDEKKIHNEAWSQLINSALLKQQAGEAGIFVSDKEIQDFFFENPLPDLARWFTDSTGFQKDKYLELITNPDMLLDMYAGNENITSEQAQEEVDKIRAYLLDAEKQVRTNKLIASLSILVGTSFGMIPPEFAKERYLAENATADANYLHLDISTVPDADVQVTDADIKAAYDRKKESFKQVELRQLKYIRLDIAPSSKDTVRAGKRIDRIMADLATSDDPLVLDSIFDVKYSEYGGKSVDFTLMQDLGGKLTTLAGLEKHAVAGPVRLFDGIYFFRMDDKRSGENEVIKASHILIKFGENKDSAKTEINKIYKKVLNGADFAELAKKHSEDKGSGMNGGDLGYFGKGKMDKDFEAAAFATAAGKVSKPVESVFGYHIIKVHDKTSDEIKYTEICIKPDVSTTTRNSVFRLAYS
ncbi:MAG: peptidylprolyl isomerase, partial [Chlorobi bacterium]|nr:peptidylprolyl isomerase [Chlorobiota bacterium]